MPRRKSATQLDHEIDEALRRRPSRRSPGRRYDHERTWRGSAVQALLFARPRWTAPRAKAWAREHGYRSDKVHQTDNYVRLRQFVPAPDTEKRTITFGDGIRAVIEEVR